MCCNTMLNPRVLFSTRELFLCHARSQCTGTHISTDFTVKCQNNQPFIAGTRLNISEMHDNFSNAYKQHRYAVARFYVTLYHLAVSVY
jgi:hypothetical protein